MFVLFSSSARWVKIESFVQTEYSRFFHFTRNQFQIQTNCAISFSSIFFSFFLFLFWSKLKSNCMRSHEFLPIVKYECEYRIRMECAVCVKFQFIYQFYECWTTTDTWSTSDHYYHFDSENSEFFVFLYSNLFFLPGLYLSLSPSISVALFIIQIMQNPKSTVNSSYMFGFEDLLFSHLPECKHFGVDCVHLHSYVVTDTATAKTSSI